MPNTDYMPRALTPTEAAEWNKRNLPTTGAARRHTETVTVSLSNDAYERWERLVNDGMPQGIAYNMIRDAEARRTTRTRWTKIELDPVERPAPERFGRTYRKGSTWTPRHARAAIEYPDVPAYIVQGRI